MDICAKETIKNLSQREYPSAPLDRCTDQNSRKTYRHPSFSSAVSRPMWRKRTSSDVRSHLIESSFESPATKPSSPTNVFYYVTLFNRCTLLIVENIRLVRVREIDLLHDENNWMVERDAARFIGCFSVSLLILFIKRWTLHWSKQVLWLVPVEQRRRRRHNDQNKTIVASIDAIIFPLDVTLSKRSRECSFLL